MKFWAAIGILAASVALGAIAYVAVDRYVYTNGININLKLIAIVGTLLVAAAVIVVAFLRKRLS